VQGEPRDGNGNRRERRPAADQPHGRAPTPPVRTPEPDNNRRANGSTNANADADAPLLFHSHAAARLLGARNLRGATSAPAVEGAARGYGSAASRKLRLTPALGARAGWSAICL
jgi:hypothetical protein